MIDDTVVVAMSVVILVLSVLLILYVLGVLGESEQPKCPASGTAIVDTQYTYRPGEKPPAAINDTTSDLNTVASRACLLYTSPSPRDRG